MSALLLVKMAGDDDNSTAEMVGGIGLAGAGAAGGYYGHKKFKGHSDRATRLANLARHKADTNVREQAFIRGESRDAYKKAKHAAKSEKTMLGKIFGFIDGSQGRGKKRLMKETNKNYAMADEASTALDKALKSGKIDGVDAAGKNKAKQYLRLLEKSKNLETKGKVAAGLGIGAGIAGTGLAGYGAYQKAHRND